MLRAGVSQSSSEVLWSEVGAKRCDVLETTARLAAQPIIDGAMKLPFQRLMLDSLDFASKVCHRMVPCVI